MDISSSNQSISIVFDETSVRMFIIVPFFLNICLFIVCERDIANKNMEYMLLAVHKIWTVWRHFVGEISVVLLSIMDALSVQIGDYLYQHARHIVAIIIYWFGILDELTLELIW